MPGAQNPMADDASRPNPPAATAPLRFLLAWELGGGLGHLVPLAQVGAPLAAQGHELHFVLRDLSGARAALGALADAPHVHLWQAPLWQAVLQAQQPPASYGELLFHAGYLDAARLLGLVRGWQSLLDAIAPDLLLADHAPTALLAARGRPMRRALIGNGFFLPPAQQPMPGFREWEPVDPQRLAYTEAHALAACNTVLAGIGAAPLAALHELTAADENFLLTWPELDHYGTGGQGRPGARYWGLLPARAQGVPAAWSDGDGPRLFAYLRGDYPAIDTVLQQLSRAPCRTLAHVPGASAALRQRLASDRLRFSDGAVAMDSAMAQAQAVLCHAGSGTVGTALQAGLPVLMLPMQVEQLIFARRACATGAAAMLHAGDIAARLLPALDELLADGTMRRHAQALAVLHGPARGGSGSGDPDVAAAVAARCIALARAAVDAGVDTGR